MNYGLKKIACLFLAFCMTVMCVPLQVFAVENSVSEFDNFESAVASASDGDVIKITSDITVSRTVNVSRNITVTSDGGKLIRSDSFSGQIFYVTGELVLKNVTLDGNRYVTDVKALAAELIRIDGGKVELREGAVLTTNRANAVSGSGGIWLESGELDMYSGSVITEMHQHNNTASNQNFGIAVHIAGGVFNMYSGKIHACDGKVGAVSNLGGIFNMYGGEISGNTANASGFGGGGVYNAGTFNMSDGIISSNVSWLKGGGVYNVGVFNLSGGSVTKNTTVRENATDCDGGGVCTSGEFNMTGGEITSNTAQNCAGGVKIDGGRFTMSAGRIEGNATSVYSGGGVFVGAGTFLMNGGSVVNNSAAQFGGGVAVTSADAGAFTFENGEIYSNTCGEKHCGADLYITTSTSRAVTSFGKGCIKYTLYIDNSGSRYSPSNAVAAPSSSLTAGNGYIYVTNGAAHSFGEWVVTEEPGCETKGLRVRVCDLCGEREEDTIAAKGHNTVAKTVQPTCSEDGSVTLYCPACGYIHNVSVIPATGHISGNWTVLEPATDANDGVKVKYCTSCHEITERAPFGSDEPLVYISASEPESLNDETNTLSVTVELKNNPGIWGANFYIYYSDIFRISSVELQGTVFGDSGLEPAVNVPVSSDAVAEEIFHASGAPVDGMLYYCFYADSESVSNLTEDGILAKLTFEYSSELEGEYKLGFAYDSDFIINSDGENVPLLFSDVTLDIEPLVLCEHVPMPAVTVPADCENDGSVTVTCEKCGKIIKKSIIPAKGHVKGEWKVTATPTETSSGEKSLCCSVCGKALSSVKIPSLSSRVVSMQSKTINESGEVTLSLSLKNNPGIWGIRAFVYYSKDVSLVSVSNGDVFADECMADTELNILPGENYSASEAFARGGVDTSDIYAHCVLFENSEFKNTNENGELVSLTFAVNGEAGDDIFVYVLFDEAVDIDMNYVPFESECGIISFRSSCAHTGAEWMTTVEATCVEGGEEALVCPSCGKVISTRATDALGHDFSDEFTVDVEPTDYEPGIKSRHCSRCSAVTDRTEIEPLGEPVLGDLNGDGRVNAVDTALMKLLLASQISENDVIVRNADFNRDGIIDTTDSLRMKEYICGLYRP